MSIYIQEVLGLLKRNKRKTTLERGEDYFEFGKLASTSRIDTSSSYVAQMEPFTIKYQDFFCDIRKDLTVTIANSGVEGKIPVYTVKDAICSSGALKDSIITQNAANDTITISGNLDVNKNAILKESIDLGTFGDTVHATSLFNRVIDSAGAVAGTANRILKSTADGRVVWSDNDPLTSLTYGSIWRGNSSNAKEELTIGTAGQVLTSDGTTASWSAAASAGVTGTGTTKHMAMWTGASSIGDASPVTMVQETIGALNVLTIGVDSDDKVVFEATVEFQGFVKDAGATFGTAGQILIADSSSQVLWGDRLSSVSSTIDGAALNVSVATETTTPAITFTWQGVDTDYVAGDGTLVAFPTIPAASVVMTSSVLGLGKLFSDTVQTVSAATVSAITARTYGVQFNSGGQLVVNVPWTDNSTTYSMMTSTVLGLGKLFSDTTQTVAGTAVSATASRTYGIQKNSSNQLVVNVPWVDTNTQNVTSVSASTDADVLGIKVTPTTGAVEVGLNINGLTAIAALADADTIPIYDGGTNKKISLLQLENHIGAAKAKRFVLNTTTPNVSQQTSPPGGTIGWVIAAGTALGVTTALDCAVEVIQTSDGATVYAEVTRSGTNVTINFSTPVSQGAYQAIVTRIY